MEQNGDTVTVTRRGRAVAVLSPPPKRKWKSPRGVLAGKVKIEGDLISPIPFVWTEPRHFEGD